MRARYLLAGAAVLAIAAGGYAWHRTTQLEKARSELAAAKQQADKLAADVASARASLEAEQAQLTRLGAELKAAKEQLARRSAVTPAAVIPIKEICAVPDKYAGETVTIRGRIFDRVTFSEPATHFRLYEDNCLVHCVFTTRDLDPDVRRMLQSVPSQQPLLLAGRLVPDKESPRAGMGTHSGYQFVVISAERAK